MMDWDTISAELGKKLDPAHVKPAPQGKFGDYVDGYHVVSEANRIFGNGGWSYEITRLHETSRIEVASTRGPQVRISYLCTVKVQVGDVFKEGAAVGMGAGKPDNLGDVIESAVKEAETDALKRALRTFGNTFGLALYDKTREHVGTDTPAFDVEAATVRLCKMVAARKTLADLAEIWTSSQDVLSEIKAVSTEHHIRVIAAKDAAKAKLQGDEGAMK